MNVLSLFDGMSCGLIAFTELGIPVDRYVAYEIDKYAVQTSKHNFPNVEQMGDVFGADFSVYEGFDILIGGSPCTYWSIAQSADKRERTASGVGWELFSQYVRALKESKPKYFLYENNKSMSKEIRMSITETFGFEPICINSALVSAQNRQRLYWVGKRNSDGTYSKVGVGQPEDRGILLKDVLEAGEDLTSKNKSWVLTSSYNGAVPWNTIERCQRNMVAEPVNTTTDGKAQCLRATCYKDGIRNMVGNDVDKRTCVAECVSSKGAPYNVVAEPVCMRYERSEEAKKCRKQYENGEIHHGFHELSELHPRTDGKTNTLSTVLKDNPICVPIVECVSSRGVYRDTGSRSRKSEAGTEQHFEVRGGGKTNALTTVQKDNMVAVGVSMQVAGRKRQEDGSFVRVPEARTDGKTTALTSVEARRLVAIQVGALPRPNGELSKSQGMRIYDFNAKSVTLTAGGGGGMGGKTGLYAVQAGNETNTPVYKVENGLIEINGKKYPIKLKDGCYAIRKLTVNECKRLQTVPDWFKFPVSNTQAYKMLGNGWTVSVIMHLLSSILKEENKNAEEH
jgi:DNA-cytosine methyltransferase